MPDDRFENACDRLSNAVDSVQFERVRWAKNEGPMLEHLVALAQAAVAERPDIELTDEGSLGAAKRFVLKVHGQRVVAVTLGLDGGRVALWAEEIERSKYKVVDGRRQTAEFKDVDATWMKDSLGALMSEVS